MEQTRGDRVLILSTTTLLLIGLIMVYSASAVLSARQYGDAFLFLKRQMIWIAVGLLGMLAASRLPYRHWQRMNFAVLSVTVLALVAVLIPSIGIELNGSRRWLRIGPLSIQPSEMARIGLVVYLASYLVKRQDRLNDFAHGFLPPIVTVGLVLSLIMAEPDLGTTAVMGLAAGILLFVGGVRLRYLFGIALPGIPILYAMIMRTDYWRERFLTFLDPWQDPEGRGFQVIQSFLSLGQGGLFGAGLGEGRQKLFFLPYPHTDFIFAVIGEELGLIGTVAVIGLFAVIAWRGLRIAGAAPDLFGKYLAFGVTMMIVLQAQVNMAVVTGLLPTKGLTLPLLSYGGSSMTATLVGIGILQSVARAPRPAKTVEGRVSGGVRGANPVHEIAVRSVRRVWGGSR